MPKLRSLLSASVGVLLALTATAAAQSDYPNRPVRLIIPFPPGGSNDVVGRMIGDQLGKQLDEVKNASESTWDSVKAGSKKAYDELKDSFQQSRQWLSDKVAP